MVAAHAVTEAGLGAVAGGLAPQFDHDLLGHLLGLRTVAYDSEHDAEDQGRERVVERGERLLVAVGDLLHDVGDVVAVGVGRSADAEGDRLVHLRRSGRGEKAKGRPGAAVGGRGVHRMPLLVSSLVRGPDRPQRRSGVRNLFVCRPFFVADGPADGRTPRHPHHL